jgi:hypothetical protein
MLMDEIKKIAKEDADLSGIEKLLTDLDPLKNLKTADDALGFIERNQVFKSALDRETTKRVENALSRFQEEKLPTILEQKLAERANPTETPEQKAVRELQSKLKAMEEKEALLTRKESFRAKAKELELDEDIAEKLAYYGDNALETLEFLGQKIKGKVESSVEREIKSRLGDNAPKRIDEQKDFDVDKEMSKFSFL